MGGNAWILISDLCYHFLCFCREESGSDSSLGKQTETF